MLELAFTRSLLRSMVLLTAASLLSCADEADVSPSTVRASTLPRPTTTPETSPTSPAPRGVGLPPVVVPPDIDPLPMPRRRSGPLSPAWPVPSSEPLSPALRFLQGEVDAGVGDE